MGVQEGGVLWVWPLGDGQMWQRGQQEKGYVSFGLYFGSCSGSSQKCTWIRNQGRMTGDGKKVEPFRDYQIIVEKGK